MANAVLTILVIAVGAAADVGVVSLLERVRPPRRKDRIRKAVRLVWLLGFLVTLLAAVPFAGYYLCALVTAPDDSFAAGWLLFSLASSCSASVGIGSSTARTSSGWKQRTTPPPARRAAVTRQRALPGI